MNNLWFTITMALQGERGQRHAPPLSQPREHHTSSVQASIPSGWPTADTCEARCIPRQHVVRQRDHRHHSNQPVGHPLLLLHRSVPRTPVADVVRDLLDSLTSDGMRDARSAALSLGNNSLMTASTSVPSDTLYKTSRLQDTRISREEEAPDSLSSLHTAPIQPTVRSPTRGRTDTVNSLPR